MLSSRLNAMSVGTLWVLRSQEESQFARYQPFCSEVEGCPICHQPWLREQGKAEEGSVLVVLAEPITDEAQQKLFQACLTAAGWNQSSCIYLHVACSSDNRSAVLALQEHIASQAPEFITVFGSATAQFIHPELIPGQIHSYARTRLIVTHHPEEMINNPALKAQVWADFCLVK
jgi:hypothetical protein